MFYLAAGDGEEAFWVQLLVMVILATGIGIYGVIKKNKAQYNSIGRQIKRAVRNLSLRGRYISKLSLRRSSEISKSLLRRGRDVIGRLIRRAPELRQTLIRRGGLIRPFHRMAEFITNRRPFFQKFRPKTTANQGKTAASPLMPLTLKSSPQVVLPRTEARKTDRPVQRGNRNFDGGMELLTTDFLVEVVESTTSTEMRDITMRTLCFAELARRGQLWVISSDALKAYTLNREEAFGKSIRYQSMKELSRRTAGGAIVSLGTNHRKQLAIDEVRAGQNS